jgi:hypothetical protein
MVQLQPQEHKLLIKQEAQPQLEHLQPLMQMVQLQPQEHKLLIKQEAQPQLEHLQPLMQMVQPQPQEHKLLINKEVLLQLERLQPLMQMVQPQPQEHKLLINKEVPLQLERLQPLMLTVQLLWLVPKLIQTTKEITLHRLQELKQIAMVHQPQHYQQPRSIMVVLPLLLDQKLGLTRVGLVLQQELKHKYFRKQTPQNPIMTLQQENQIIHHNYFLLPVRCLKILENV